MKSNKRPASSGNEKLRKLTAMGMFAALSFAAVLLGKLIPPIMPAAPFLSYEPKDVIVAICGMLFGPLEAFAVTLTVSLIEMVTISQTGVVGMLMNLISTGAFACTASLIYRKKRKLSGAVVGIVSGVGTMVLVMLLWNYLITPLYMKVEREMVKALLFPVFLPFNLIKGAANGCLTMLLYKPIVTGLRASRLVPSQKDAKKRKVDPFVIGISLFIIACCVLFVLVLNGVI